MRIGVGLSIPELSTRGGRFSPESLFTGGVQGAWYDPSDYSTLFQDSAGTTPVTAVEQPVGLMLDKSQGLVLGSELVTNGDFASSSGWTLPATGTNSITGGQAVLSGASGYLLRTGTNITAGQWYRVSFTISGYSGSGTVRPYIQASPVFGSNVTGNGTFVQYLLATTTNVNTEIGLNFASSFTGNIDDISIKSFAGNHASQATAASRPVLRARYNLLTYSEQFDNAAWTKAPTGVITAITADTTVAPDGTTTADRIASTASGTFRAVRRSPAGLTANTQFTFSVYAKAGTTNWIVMRFWDSGASGINAWFNVSTGAVGTVESGCTATITPANNGFYRCTYTRTVGATIAFNEIDIGVCDSDNTQNANTGANVSIWGADLRTGSSAGTYQRIAAATVYDTTGFLPYLYFVTDDSFSTNSINFSATDKMSVCAGLTKLSDAAAGTVVELSDTADANNGTIFLRAPQGAAANYIFRSRGTLTSNAISPSNYAAPITNVISGLGNISGDSTILRVNGAVATTDTADQGTGNYGNWPLFIGRRNNASVPFEGRIYQLIVCGKTLSASELASTEAYVATKTGVTL